MARVSNTQSPRLSVQWIDAAKAAHFDVSQSVSVVLKKKKKIILSGSFSKIIVVTMSFLTASPCSLLG